MVTHIVAAVEIKFCAMERVAIYNKCRELACILLAMQSLSFTFTTFVSICSLLLLFLWGGVGFVASIRAAAAILCTKLGDLRSNNANGL